jgi:transcriptional regulator with XRE-family HTH domain
MEVLFMRETLKKARLAKGLTVAEIANLVNVSPAVYYKWEDGTRDPLIDNARQVASILGATIEELFFSEETALRPTGTQD